MSPVLNFGLLAETTKIQPLKLINGPWQFSWARHVSLEDHPWVMSHIQVVFFPGCHSNATTVGYCWCLLLAPNQELKSLHGMPVWDEQVARMVWQRAMLLKIRKVIKPKSRWSGSHGLSAPKDHNRIAQFDYVRCVRPWFVNVCHSYHAWKTSKLEIENGWSPDLRQVTPFPGKLHLFKPQDFGKHGTLLCYTLSCQ